MADRGERAVRKLLQEKNGKPWTAKDMRELIFAQADDQEDDHIETMKRIAVMDADLADARAAMLLHHEWADTELKPAVQKLREDVDAVAPDHAVTHAAHMAEHHAPRRETVQPFPDPEGADFRGKRGRSMDDPSDGQFLETRESAHPDETDAEMRVSYRAGKFIIGTLVAVLLVVAVNFATNRISADSAVKVNESDLKELVNLIKQESQEPLHATATPTPIP